MEVDIDSIRLITETSLTIRGSRRRTTVPKDIVERLQLKDGDRVRWLLFNDDTIMIRKVNN